MIHKTEGRADARQDRQISPPSAGMNLWATKRPRHQHRGDGDAKKAIIEPAGSSPGSQKTRPRHTEGEDTTRTAKPSITMAPKIT